MAAQYLISPTTRLPSLRWSWWREHLQAGLAVRGGYRRPVAFPCAGQRGQCLQASMSWTLPTQACRACRIDPLDFAKESVGLVDLIDRLTLNQPILQPPAQAGAGYGGRQPGAAPGEHP